MEDISALIRKKQLQGIGAVGNYGTLFTCEKVYGYNANNAMDFLNKLSSVHLAYKTNVAARYAFMNDFAKEEAKRCYP